MKFRFIIFALTISVFVLNMSCKKYPEDPFIAFRTVKMRLEGEWQLEKIEINDENVGYKYNDSLAPLTFKDLKFWFKFDHEIERSGLFKKQTENFFLINKSSKNCLEAFNNADVSGVAFSVYPKKEKNLSIASLSKIIPVNDSMASKILLNLLSDHFWNIKRLYNKQLIIEKNKSSFIYRLSFKKTRSK